MAPLPNVDMPVIFVSAQMPGASPGNHVHQRGDAAGAPSGRHRRRRRDDLVEFGRARPSIVLQFDINRDIDGAARDVQAAINAARADLPAALRSNPTYRKINPADQPILILALTSKTLTPGQIYDSASNILQQKLSQVPGIGQVQLSGSSLPAVRVELNPRALFKYGIGLEDVRAALSAANANAPKGAIEQGAAALSDLRQRPGDQGGRFSHADRRLSQRRGGPAVRRGQMSTDGVEDVRNLGMANGKPAILVILFRAARRQHHPDGRPM